MGIGKTIQTFSISDVTGGCNYADDLPALKENMSPDSMNVEFYNGRLRKRKGSVVVNVDSYMYDEDVLYDAPISYNYGKLVDAKYGYSLADFSDSNTYHQQIAHIDNTVYAYDRITNTNTVLRANAPRTRSFSAKVKDWLIQTYNDYSLPYYWNGAASSMSVLTNAPGFRRAIEFQGYLMGMGTDANKMRVYYQATSDMLGAVTAYTDYFTLSPAPNDDAITDPFLLNGRLYAGTRTGIFRISFVGGVTVFDFKQVISDVGIVPNTTQAVVTKEFGQVVLFLGTDKRVYLFDGANIKTVSDLYYPHNDDTPISLDLIDDNYLENSFAVYDFPKRVYRLFVTKKASSTNYYSMNIDVDSFSYYPYDNMKFSAGAMCYDALLRPFLLCLDYEGQIHKMFVEANTDNGEAINEYYTSPLVSVKGPYMKQGQDIAINQRPTSSANLVVEDRVDFRSIWQRRTTLPCASSRDRFLGESFVLGAALLGSEKIIADGRISLPVSFNDYQFRLYSDSPTARAWEIYNIDVNQTVLVFGKAEAQR